MCVCVSNTSTCVVHLCVVSPTAIPTVYVSCWEYCYSYTMLAAGSTAIPTVC